MDSSESSTFFPSDYHVEVDSDTNTYAGAVKRKKDVHVRILEDWKYRTEKQL